MNIVLRRLLVLALLAGSILLSPGPARADLAGYRWSGRWVCVEDHVNDSWWPLHKAVWRWDHWNSGARTALRASVHGDCSGWKHRVIVRPQWHCWIDGKDHAGYAAISASDGWIVSPVRICLNMTMRKAGSWWAHVRLGTVSHELGHAWGLAHTKHFSSVMCMADSCSGAALPTTYDRHEINRLY